MHRSIDKIAQGKRMEMPQNNIVCIIMDGNDNNNCNNDFLIYV